MPNEPDATLDDLLDTRTRTDPLYPSERGDDDRHDTDEVADLRGPVAEPDESDDLVDEADYVDAPKRRSRLTTILIVVLIFLLGVLVGTQAGALAARSGAPGGSRPAAISSTAR